MLKKIKQYPFYFMFFLTLGTISLYNIVMLFYGEDTPFLLSTGREILENGIIKENPFFVLPNYQLIVQQWLYDVILYKIYDIFGAIGLLCFVIMIVICCGVTLYHLTQTFHIDKIFSMILCFAYIIINNDYVSTRPTLLTLMLLMMQLICCEKYKKKSKNKYLLMIVLLAWLEINLHSCLWLMHFIFMLPYIFPQIPKFFIEIPKRQNKVKPFLITTVGMFLVGLINPYGIKAITCLPYAEVNTIRKLGIAELQYADVLSPSGILMFLSIIMLLCLVFQKKMNIDHIYLCAGLAAFGCIYLRNMPYGSLSFIILCCYLLKDYDMKKFHNFINSQKPYTYIVYIFIIVYTGINIFKIGISTESTFKVEPIVEWLNENAEKGSKVYASFNVGAEVELNGYKIYMEGRTEGYAAKINGVESILDEYLHWTNDTITKEEYNDFMNKYDFDYVVIDATDINLGAFIQFDNNYEKVFESDWYILYKQKNAVES